MTGPLMDVEGLSQPLDHGRHGLGRVRAIGDRQRIRGDHLKPSRPLGGAESGADGAAVNWQSVIRQRAADMPRDGGVLTLMRARQSHRETAAVIRRAREHQWARVVPGGGAVPAQRFDNGQRRTV